MSQAKRVLLIEDHDDTRKVMAVMLEHAQFYVMAYDHCAPAERHLKADDVDIALLDVRLPGRCGDDFGKALRAKSPKTMIVFLTGEQLLEPIKAAVADCFVLRKPVDFDALLELMRCFCSDDGYGSRISTDPDGRAGPGAM